MEENYEIVCSLESKPLSNLNELLDWNCIQECTQSKAYSLHRLQTHRTSSKRTFKTLLCHDMKGGYLDDRFNDGCANHSAYSHEFITIPPIAWINASHKNSVPILGTFIVEGWAQTKLICSQILSDSQTIDKVVSKLVEIASYHLMDGWLINIECEIDPNLIESLISFVELLTNAMHTYNAHSLVIWYDSVISPGGQLKWQNELNSSNKCFFDVSDAIFLNYTWNEANLKASYEMARNMSRNYDVFVGIDVFGRNCFGGGGMNTNSAVNEIRKYELSIAIFASAWTYEVLGPQSFTSNEYLFWSSLNLGVHHWPHKLPIATSFCQGFGYKLYRSGRVCSDKSWHNLNVQELQPTHHNCAHIYLEEAFNGGGCLKLTNHSVPLFLCDVTIERCFYSITYKSDFNHKLDSILKYETNGQNDNKNLLLFDNDLDSEENNDFSVEYITSNNYWKQELRKFNRFGIFETNTGWLTQAFLLHSKTGQTKVKAIELRVRKDNDHKPLDVLIGQLIFDSTDEVLVECKECIET